MGRGIHGLMHALQQRTRSLSRLMTKYDSTERGSFWTSTGPDKDHPRLEADLDVDVLIVGGGIFGMTVAVLLAGAGLTIALIEARRIGRQVTGRSTAKLTAQHGLIYASLIERYGPEGARVYARANQAAVDWVAARVNDQRLDCDLERKSAYLFTREAGSVVQLEREAAAARLLGLPAEVAHEACRELPFGIAAAVCLHDQVQLHPHKYVSELARVATERKVQVFEHTRATSVEDGLPCRVTTDRGTVTARNVVIATHMPIVDEGQFFGRTKPHALPVLAAPIEPARAPHGMLLSIDSPGLSAVRAVRDGQPYLIATGDAFSPGHTQEGRARMEDLEREVRDLFGVREVSCRWTNHDYMPEDQLPYVGRASKECEHLYVGTGFNAWGLSNGTAAAMIVHDAILGRANAWARLFDSTREKSGGSSSGLSKAGSDDEPDEHRQSQPEHSMDVTASSPDGLQRGEAAVFELGEEEVAAYRDDSGRLFEVSAACTHKGCTVGWNAIQSTWDCHCHGSRFTPDGDVITGPAVERLAAANKK